MNTFWKNLKAAAEANPLYAIGAAAFLLTAASKVLDANTQRSYAKTHAREVDRRIMSNLKK